MIKINDIRIGNYVAYADCGAYIPELIGKPHKIVVEDFGMEYRKYGVIRYYDPIPLTEETLLKAGFEQDGNRYSKNKIVLRENAYYDEDESGNEITSVKLQLSGLYCSDLFYHKSYSPNIPSVHQLQNLYYALTGQELEIEL